MGERAPPQCGSHLCIGLILSSVYILSIQAQSIPGFLSIDCGSDPYSDEITKLSWESDSTYISSGASGVVPFTVNSTLDNAVALQTFRYFPDKRSKFCYDLPTTTGNISFLLRTMFLHGSAVELTLPIKFSVYVNDTALYTITYNIDATYDELTSPLTNEAIFYSAGNLTHLCLVPETGSPFISSVELRQLSPDGLMYAYPGSTGQYLSKLRRINCGAPSGTATVRYPDDPFDRLWDTPGAWASGLGGESGTVNTATSSSINNVPPKVMKDAWLDDTANSTIWFSFSGFGSTVTEVYIAVYYEEIETDGSDGDRHFLLGLNGEQTNETVYKDPYLQAFYDWNVPNDVMNFTFTATNDSLLGPIVNAVEMYAQYSINDTITAPQDVDALTDLKVSFNMTDWQGDPCYPVPLDWVSCTADTPARVDELLMSNMGIHGSIPSTISNLVALTHVELDNNYLTGSIPDSLASLPKLVSLSLQNNDLSGEIPPALEQKLGSDFDYSGNSLLGAPPAPNKKKKSSNVGVVIGAIAGGVAALAILLCLLLWCCCSKRKGAQKKSLQKIKVADAEKQASSRPSPLRQSKPQTPLADDSGPQPPIMVKQPTEVGNVSYETVQLATNNFNVKIGQGSYGSVYHGWLNNREVAVKLNSIQSEQGHNEFITEVDILTRVHHRNLVSLIGYCDEGKELILIYEFEVNGTLRDWIHDEAKTRGTLDWKRRLQIAADGAKGLEYLHKGCDPTIIHRDVKSNNILLDDTMTAKVADFGLSKAAPNENTMGYSTGVKGTPGYLDPEYHQLGRLTHKSDVYSYGVVLAEIITGRPPFKLQSGSSSGSSAVILVDYLRKMVERNDIETLADPTLRGSFNPESMWRMADIALACVNPLGGGRPDFTQVVSGINEAIELEKNFTVHSPLAPPRSFMSRSGSSGYQNLQ